MDTIDNIPELIYLIINIFSKKINILPRHSDSIFYFSNAGCIEMAKIIKHYFPNSNYLIRNDKKYAAILYNNEIFDVFDGVLYNTLKNNNISLEKIEKKKEDFKIVGNEEFEEFSKTFGEALYYDGKTFDEAIICEIEKYNIKIGGNNEKYIY